MGGRKVSEDRGAGLPLLGSITLLVHRTILQLGQKLNLHTDKLNGRIIEIIRE